MISAWHLPFGVASVTLAVGVAISTQLASLDLERQAAEERGALITELGTVRAQLEGVVKATFSSTDGLVNLIALQGGISPELFADMARLSIGKNAHIRNITLAPNDQVKLVYPLAGNERVLGFRYASSPEQYLTVTQARERGEAILAGPVNLIQGGLGLINRAPIFSQGELSAGGARVYWGTASVVTNVNSLLTAGGLFSVRPGLQLALRGKDGKGQNGDVIEGNPLVFSLNPVTAIVPVPGGEWQLAAVPQGGWRSTALYRSLYFQIGLINALLLAGIFAMLAIRNRQMRASNVNLVKEIDVRQKAENALREEKQRFHSLFESLPDPVWIIEGNRFVDCNEMAAAMLGYLNKDELLFVHPSKLSPAVQPDGESSFSKAERMLQLAREHGLHRFEWVHTRADGANFLAEVTLRLITLQGKEAIYCVWRDITQRKLDEERLQLAATVLATTVEGVVITDATAKIISINAAFTEITGYEAEDAIGNNPRILHSERQKPEFYQSMWSALLQAGVWQGEIWNRRKNGEIFPEWLTITAIRDNKDQLTHYVGVFSDISSLKHSQAQLERLAHFDPLTDLPNRALFQDRLAHAIDRAQRYEQMIGVLLIDLDGFKNVNDSLGHPVGDQLLQEVALRLKSCIRIEDTAARMGGDEFALVLVNMLDGSCAIEVVRKILAAIQLPFDLDGLSAQISASIGIAIYPADGENATELVRNADAAMYGAKEAGRNGYCFYQAAMTLRAQERLMQERALRRAIEAHEFEVWFQPQLSLQSGRLTGAEALVRWRDPSRGLVPPNDFIPLAESTGLIVQLGEQVLQQVVACARRWLDAGLVFGRLAVNVAPSQIERSNFVQTLEDALKAADLPADCLEIEITESLIMKNAAHARDILLAIQALGVTTSVDDFGTGYSSLAYLKALPIDNLKIDRAFVMGLPEDGNDQAIVRAIISMARSLGFKVIAEGIETQAQQDFLQAEGCDEAQGYYFSKPLPVAEFELWLAQHQH